MEDYLMTVAAQFFVLCLAFVVIISVAGITAFVTIFLLESIDEGKYLRALLMLAVVFLIISLFPWG